MKRTNRRRVLLATGAGLAALAGCAARREPTSSPTETGTPTQTPTETGTPTPSPTPVDVPGVAWRRDVEAAVTALSSDDDAVYVGTEDPSVRALDGDGADRWRVAANGPVQQVEPAGDTVFVVVGTNGLGSNHRVFALDAASGATRWEFAPEEWWLSVLGVHDETVYVATEDDAIAPDGQTLYAMALADGSVQWSGEVGDSSGGLVTDETVYAPNYQRLYAYDHDGTGRWTREVTDYGFETLTVVGETVAFAAEQGDDHRQAAFGLSTADGSDRWTVDGWFVTSLREYDGRLFAGGEHVVEIDPASGETRWQFDAGGSIYDTPVVDDTLFTSGETIHAVSISDGTERWSFETDFYLTSPAGVVGDTLYVFASESRDDRNRHVLALDWRDGSERFRFAADAPLEGVVLAGDRAVAGSERGYVYGFERI